MRKTIVFVADVMPSKAASRFNDARDDDWVGGREGGETRRVGRAFALRSLLAAETTRQDEHYDGSIGRRNGPKLH